jgi:spectrin beta
MADDMIQNKHPDSTLIGDRRNQVVGRSDRVKDKSNARHNQLVDSNAYHIFKRDADELSDWVKDKYRTATDESYRDLTNLLPKLQKHQAFEAELKANKEILGQVNEVNI